MSRVEESRLAIVGAGSVGSSTAYAALIRGSARAELDRLRASADAIAAAAAALKA